MIDFSPLFYAELGSVIRAPFLTDRSILITKSSACSKGSALWRPRAAGPAARATPADRKGKKQPVDELPGPELEPRAEAECLESVCEEQSASIAEFLHKYFTKKTSLMYI